MEDKMKKLKQKLLTTTFLVALTSGAFYSEIAGAAAGETAAAETTATGEPSGRATLARGASSRVLQSQGVELGEGVVEGEMTTPGDAARKIFNVFDSASSEGNLAELIAFHRGDVRREGRFLCCGGVDRPVILKPLLNVLSDAEMEALDEAHRLRLGYMSEEVPRETLEAYGVSVKAALDSIKDGNVKIDPYGNVITSAGHYVRTPLADLVANSGGMPTITALTLNLWAKLAAANSTDGGLADGAWSPSMMSVVSRIVFNAHHSRGDIYTLKYDSDTRTFQVSHPSSPDFVTDKWDVKELEKFWDETVLPRLVIGESESKGVPGFEAIMETAATLLGISQAAGFMAFEERESERDVAAKINWNREDFPDEIRKHILKPSVREVLEWLGILPRVEAALTITSLSDYDEYLDTMLAHVGAAAPEAVAASVDETDA